MMKWALFFSLFLAVPQLFGQRYEVKNLSTERSKSRGSLFLGMDKQGMMYIASERKFSFILINVSNPWMKVISSESGALVAEAPLDTKELKELGFKYITSVVIHGKPVVIARERTDLSGEFYYALNLDRNLKIIGAPYKIGKSAICRGFGRGVGKSFSTAMSSYMDDNRVTTYVSDISCSTHDKPSLQVFQLNENNNELLSFGVQLPTTNPISNTALVTARNGIYFTCSAPAEMQQRRNVVHAKSHLFLLDATGEVTPISLDVGNEEAAAQLALLVMDNTVKISGQLIAQESGKLVGVFTADLDETSLSLVDIKRNYFEAEFVSRYWNESTTNRMARRGDITFPNSFKTIDYFETEDGGAAYILQKHYVERVLSSRASAAGMYTTDVDYYFYYEDVIVCKISPEGTMQWAELLPLEEVSLNRDPKITFVVGHRNGELYLMHASNDVRKEMINKQQPMDRKDQRRDRILSDVAITHIDNFGTVRTTHVLDLKELGIHFSPRATAVDQMRRQFTVIGTPRQLFSMNKRLSIISVRF